MLIAPAVASGRPVGSGARHALAWMRVMAAMTLLTVACLAVSTRGGSRADPWGHPLAADFTSFWTSARLALAGAPATAWEPPAHAAAERALFPAEDGYAPDYYAFFYPPPFLLLLLPLGLLPYGAAVAAWLLATGIAYLAALRALLPRRWPAVLPGLAFPALLLNAEHGQNGALSAALLGAAACQLDRRPRLAGACLGALCIKPQLALLVVPALLAARRVRVLAWAAASAGLLCLASLLVLGSACWRGFLDDAPLAGSVLEAGLVEYGKMASGFAAARLLGAGVGMAWAVQAMASVLALAGVVEVARRRPGGVLEIAALAAGSCLATPFLLDYDLTVLAVPLAAMAAAMARDGARRWDMPVLVATVAMTLLVRPLALRAGVPIAPPVVACLLLAMVARVRSARPHGRGRRLSTTCLAGRTRSRA